MLTDRQREIWEFLVRYVEAHGYPPTVREIGQEVGLASPSTVHAHLANLERAGMLRRDPTKPRALELLAPHRRESQPQPEPDVHRLPLVGQIAAGGPLLAEQNVEEYLAVPEPLARGGEEFLLRVRGESMINAGILDGDFVVVRRQQDAGNGEIVAALAGEDEAADEATVKRFYRENGRVRLQPENDALEPMYPPYVQVLGKVIGVFRMVVRERGCAPVPHARPGAVRARPRREPRVPRLRRVRHAGARRPALLRVWFDAGRGRIRNGGAGGTIDHAGRVIASLRARGKSGHRRAGRWGNPRRRKPTESGTERRPPAAIELSGDAGGKGERVG